MRVQQNRVQQNRKSLPDGAVWARFVVAAAPTL